MGYRAYEHWSDPEIVRVRAIWPALALSLLVHTGALWEWLPRMRALNGDLQSTQVAEAPLAVQLTPRRSEPSTQVGPPPLAQPRIESRVRPPTKLPRPAIRKPATAPPVIATAPPQTMTVPPPPEPTPAIPPPPVEPAPAPESKPPAPPIETDLSAYIAARRHERGDAAPAPSTEEREKARRDQIVAANLATVNAYGSGGTQSHGGGVFAIVRMGESDGEFMFHGWNGKIHGQLSQRIEVQRGSESDIRVAMIRRMIAIIREYEHDDFVWESRRLGRDITLSARMSDNAELEAFLQTEFFDANGQPR